MKKNRFRISSLEFLALENKVGVMVEGMYGVFHFVGEIVKESEDRFWIDWGEEGERLVSYSKKTWKPWRGDGPKIDQERIFVEVSRWEEFVNCGVVRQEFRNGKLVELTRWVFRRKEGKDFVFEKRGGSNEWLKAGEEVLEYMKWDVDENTRFESVIVFG